MKGDASSHHADEEVGDQEGDEDDEEKKPDQVGFPATPEELDLSEKAVPLSGRPEFYSDKEEDGGRHDG